MKQKTMPSLTVVSVEIETNMANMFQDIGDLPRLIVKELVNADLHITGPQNWVYTWESLNQEANFKLKICLPVADFKGQAKLESPYKLEQFEPFNCLETEHVGSWASLKDSYARLMEYAGREKIQLSHVCREVYYNCDFNNPANNITFIQMGTKS